MWALQQFSSIRLPAQALEPAGMPCHPAPDVIAYAPLPFPAALRDTRLPGQSPADISGLVHTYTHTSICCCPPTCWERASPQQQQASSDQRELARTCHNTLLLPDCSPPRAASSLLPLPRLYTCQHFTCRPVTHTHRGHQPAHTTNLGCPPCPGLHPAYLSSTRSPTLSTSIHPPATHTTRLSIPLACYFSSG